MRSRSPSQIVSIEVYFPSRTFERFRPLAEDAISLEIPLRMDLAMRGFPIAFFTWDNKSSSDSFSGFLRRIPPMMALGSQENMTIAFFQRAFIEVEVDS